MKLIEKVLLQKLKEDPVKVRNEVLNMDTLDYRTKAQIVALTFVYEGRIHPYGKEMVK